MKSKIKAPSIGGIEELRYKDTPFSVVMQELISTSKGVDQVFNAVVDGIKYDASKEMLNALSYVAVVFMAAYIAKCKQNKCVIGFSWHTCREIIKLAYNTYMDISRSKAQCNEVKNVLNIIRHE